VVASGASSLKALGSQLFSIEGAILQLVVSFYYPRLKASYICKMIILVDMDELCSLPSVSLSLSIEVSSTFWRS
jgi:hypothetical protein